MTAVKGKLVNNLRCSSDGGQIMRQLFGECHRELPSVQEGEKNKLSRCEKLLDGFFFFFFCRLPTIPEIMISAGQVVCLRVFLFLPYLSRKSLGGIISHFVSAEWNPNWLAAALA